MTKIEHLNNSEHENDDDTTDPKIQSKSSTSILSRTTISNLKPSKHQAAGHDGCLTSDSIFIKPTIKQELDFYNYINGIDQISESKNEDIYLGSLLSHWMPKFYGNLQEGKISNTEINPTASFLNLDTNSTESFAKKDSKDYIVLQNLYHGFKKPNIMDIKLGSKLTDDSKTPPEKIERLAKVSKNTTSGSHSFRICGMKVYNQNQSQTFSEEEIFDGMLNTVQLVSLEEENNNSTQETYFQFNKFFGRSLNSTNIENGINLFFKLSHFKPNQIRHLIEIYLKRLQLIYNCLLDYDVRMYSSSLLFIYEGDSSVWNEDKYEDYDSSDPIVKDFELSDDDEEDSVEKVDDLEQAVLNDYKVIKSMSDESSGTNDTKNSSPLSSLHLIDFAHSKPTPKEGYDENVIKGIENLIDIFSNIQKQYI
ncbi:uncharacterized protein KGF55_001569 [Candida pseudojiufengensis]|uniref:uncharacterized protein n=1 Tax=Candida pseudojiufengensis TaxID=497109 RepID=UPI0022256C92|nr:uncharacterized protein KGF55_001569 [Candida pseudojiufengensis]KAI5965348.1 hypothetical protein KGF55_001569 [Candida pseudojiufengensis]